jgi:amino acid adenylation domain-containing protein
MGIFSVNKLLALPKLLKRSTYSDDRQDSILLSENSTSHVVSDDQLTVLELPTDRPRSNVKTYTEVSQSLFLERTLNNSLQSLLEEEGIQLSTKLLTAFYLLLNRYTNQNRLIIGTQIIDRSLSRSTIVSFQLQEDLNFLQLSQNVSTAIDLAQEWDDNSIKENSLFQIMFRFKGIAEPETKIDCLDLDKLGLDLILEITQESEGLACVFIYNGNLFQTQTISRMAAHLQTLLKGIIDNPEAKAIDLPLLTPSEQQQILVTWNNTKTENNFKNLCLHQLCELQAQKTPDNLALVFEERELTYQELDRQANQLAHYLQKLGVKPDVLVGICVERSLETIVGILAILKAGGAYLPLDPTYPIDRINYMLEDTKLEILLTQQSLNLDLNLSEQPKHIVYLDRWSDIAKESNLKVETPVAPHNLAYVIYTSGSTGKPKGVQIEHRTAVNLVMAMADGKPGIAAGDTLLSVTTICFDISVADIFLPLIVGAKLAIISRLVAADGKKLAKEIDRLNPTLMQATPVTWQLLLAGGWQGSLQLKILSGGEPLSKELAERLLPKCAQLWNIYGPTEATVWSSAYRVRSLENSISIGRPLNNVKYYILDAHWRPLPVGVPGELYIGGDCLARGYLNRPELTADKFIRDPFAEKPEARIYKTGDLARYLEDGTVDCLGRLDRQVKIRGFRVEIGEIETIIGQYDGVKHAVVIDMDDLLGTKRLVAYLVIDGQKIPSNRELRSFLQQQLPDYMIPSAFVIIDKLPETLNGKIDRLALPPADFSNRFTDDNYVAPRNSLEAKLVGIWEKILQIKPISITSNFADLGGNSILAVSLIAEIEQTLQKSLAISRLTTIECMAKTLQSNDTQELLPIFSSISIEQSRLLSTIVSSRNGTRNRPDSLMVAMRDRGTKPPIFICANAYEEIAPLSQYLDPERALYFLESGYFAIEGTNSQIKELAAYHIRDILAVQTEAPYFLCGYSHGGILAWEIAQQLEALGKPVAMLFILDTPGDKPSYQLYEHLDYILRTNWNYLTNFLGITKLSSVALSTQSRIDLDRSLANLQDPYIFQSYNRKICLLTATKTDRHSFFSQKLKLWLFPKLGWQSQIASQLEVTKIPGDHFSILEEPNVRVLAAKLNNYLANAEIQNNSEVEIVLTDLFRGRNKRKVKH